MVTASDVFLGSLLNCKVHYCCWNNIIYNRWYKNTKETKKGITPFCQTINVVIFQKEKAPPAFAATTILIQAIQIKDLFPFATAITTAHINKA